MGSIQPMVDSWVSTSRSACVTCNSRPDCIPAGLNARELARLAVRPTAEQGWQAAHQVFELIPVDGAAC
jgi:hypothetical protein